MAQATGAGGKKVMETMGSIGDATASGRKIAMTILRWAARFWSIPGSVALPVPNYMEGLCWLQASSVREAIGHAGFLAVLPGLILAWRWEGWGRLLSVGGIVVPYVTWGRPLGPGCGERPVTLYGEGWATQVRLNDALAAKRAGREARSRQAACMEEELTEQELYVPFGLIRMIVARRAGVPSPACPT